MTCKEILELEETNTNCIYLHYEGNFLRAYEHSAYFAHRYIHEFKVTKTYIKVVNQDVVRIGFPVNVFEKWAHGYVHEWVDEKLAKIEMREPFDQNGRGNRRSHPQRGKQRQRLPHDRRNNEWLQWSAWR